MADILSNPFLGLAIAGGGLFMSVMGFVTIEQFLQSRKQS